MRKVFVLIAFSSFLFACGGSGSGTPENKDSANTASNQPSAAEEAEHQKALEMIASSNCLTCHKIDEKVIGPSYMEVAQKRENTPAMIDTLANKIIHGGSGVYGPVPMTPHPELSMDSARVMVKYILSLRNKQ